jgi:hypothetical protein
MKRYFSIVALLIVVLPCCKPMELKQLEELTSRAVIHTDTSTINIELQDEHSTRKVNTGNIYYWFSHGKINTSQGYQAGKLLHGVYAEYDRASKKPIESGKFNKGLKVGKWLSWKKDGFLKEVKFYKKGELSGPLVKYDAAGKPTDTIKYKQGVLVQERVEPADSAKVSILEKMKRFIKLKKK